ncbi:hypothetical protein [Streptomyces sp. NPDC059122]|uniref:hypothetical protein n=1 Tax=Streptomyces sp. NPDC059122 TaxID=3346732 RepID=UPI00368109B1
MNLVENVVAGLLVALFLGCTRRFVTWWHRHGALLVTSAIFRLESPMGSPLAKPDLLPSAHRQLNDELHELHSRANYPSMRSLARVMGVSPTTLSDSMTKAKLPSKDTAVRLALALAERIRWDADVDVDEQEDRIDRQIARLWEKARQEAEPPDHDRVAEAVQQTWEDFANGFWPHPRGFD